MLLYGIKDDIKLKITLFQTFFRFQNKKLEILIKRTISVWKYEFLKCMYILKKKMETQNQNIFIAKTLVQIIINITFEA